MEFKRWRISKLPLNLGGLFIYLFIYCLFIYLFVYFSEAFKFTILHSKYGSQQLKDQIAEEESYKISVYKSSI